MSEHLERPSADAVGRQIRKFVEDQFPLAKQRPPADGDSLLDSGIVDSLGILEIVNFLTATFGIEITDDDLQPENFDSIDSLRGFVLAKTPGA